MIEKKTTVVSGVSATPSIKAKTTVTSGFNPVQTSDPIRFFQKDNYVWMLAGLVVIAIGMFVMSGGKSSNPGVFDQKEVYSSTRITIAPLLILIGLGLEVFAIFKKPRANQH
ncbi:MAG: DUF3098 domain-containing protein [Chitinophagaceae bacterium]